MQHFPLDPKIIFHLQKGRKEEEGADELFYVTLCYGGTYSVHVMTVPFLTF
jgi:hypothetical protein